MARSACANDALGLLVRDGRIYAVMGMKTGKRQTWLVFTHMTSVDMCKAPHTKTLSTDLARSHPPPRSAKCVSALSICPDWRYTLTLSPLVPRLLVVAVDDGCFCCWVTRGSSSAVAPRVNEVSHLLLLLFWGGGKEKREERKNVDLHKARGGDQPDARTALNPHLTIRI